MNEPKLPSIHINPLVQILIKHLKQIEIIYYMEGKDCSFRAAMMRSQAQSAIEAFDNFPLGD